MNNIEIPEELLNNGHLLILDLRYHKTLKAAAAVVGKTPSAITQMVSSGKLNMHEVPELGLKFVDVREISAIPVHQLEVPEKFFMMNNEQLGRMLARLLANYQETQLETQTHLQQQTQQNQALTQQIQELEEQYQTAQVMVEKLTAQNQHLDLLNQDLTQAKNTTLEKNQALTQQVQEVMQKWEVEKKQHQQLKDENYQLQSQQQVAQNNQTHLEKQILELAQDKKRLQQQLDSQTQITQLVERLTQKLSQ